MKKMTKEMQNMRGLIEAIIVTANHYCGELNLETLHPPELAERVGEENVEQFIKDFELIMSRYGEIIQCARPLLQLLKYGVPLKNEK